MTRYRVVVAWTSSEAYEVDAEDEDDARDLAIDECCDEHPFADDYEIVFDPVAVKP